MILNWYILSYINLIFPSEIPLLGVLTKLVMRRQIRPSTSIENGVRHHQGYQLYM